MFTHWQPDDDNSEERFAPPGASIDFRSLFDSNSFIPVQPSSFSFTPEVAVAKLRKDGLAVIESVVTHLDQFCWALGDTTLPACDLEPYVSVLEEETLSLLDICSQFPEDDPFAPLLNRVATVTYLATVKFRRGDYFP